MGFQDFVTAVVGDKLAYSVKKQLPSLQVKRGDRKLERALEIAHEFESVISESEHIVIKERVTFAREIKDGLHSKPFFSKFTQSLAYRRAARDAYRYSKVPFAHSLQYGISYYPHHSLHRREARAKWEVLSLIRRVQPSHVPEISSMMHGSIHFCVCIAFTTTPLGTVTGSGRVSLGGLLPAYPDSGSQILIVEGSSL